MWWWTAFHAKALVEVLRPINPYKVLTFYWHTKLIMTDVVVNCIRKLRYMGNELYKDYAETRLMDGSKAITDSLTPFIVTNYWPFISHQRNRNEIMNYWNKIRHWSYICFFLSNPGVMRTWASFSNMKTKRYHPLWPIKLDIYALELNRTCWSAFHKQWVKSPLGWQSGYMGIT